MKPGIASVCLLSTITLYNLALSPATAQISSDGTLSTTVTTNDGINFLIENGDRAGDNLFHSFSAFSIPNLGEAYFNNNATDIVNIFSRVTGGNISDIQGLIRANGTANLFLINPAGIVFGENAALDIGGSFFATTAESVVFGDDLEFSATEPQQAAPLLTVNITPGLQMGANPGKITVQGNGHNLTAADPVFSPYAFTQPNPGLQVQPGNIIALIGSDITLEGGVLTAESGRIDLIAIGNNQSSPPLVNLSNTSSGWNVNSVELQQLGDINLTQESLLDASATGSIQLQGRNITFRDGSLALIQNTTSVAAGDITIRSAEVLQLDGMSTNGEIRSGLENQTIAAGNAGGIQVIASDVMIKDGAAIFARSFSSGATGDIVINAADKIQAQGFSLLNPGSNANSLISTVAFDTGDSGNIEVSATNLALLDSGIIITLTFGEGNAGKLRADVINSIETSGLNPVTASISALSSSSFGAGNAGDSSINTGQLILSNQGRVTTAGFATGDAGNVVVNASQVIEISGESTSIDSSVDILSEIVRAIFRLPDTPSGNAGRVTINTPVLRLEDQGAVSVRNEGAGNAGNLEINADSVIINQQGVITASTTTGTGGNIQLQAQTLDIDHQGEINASTLSGKGGDIQLQIAESLQLRNNGQIVADAQQAGEGGNITITAPETILTQDSSISTNVQGTATGGELSLTGDRLSIFDGSVLSAITGGSGQAGNILVQVEDITISGVANTEITGVGFTPTPSLIGAGSFPGSSGQGGSVTVISDRINISDGGLITTGTVGLETSGDVEISASESVVITGISDLNAPFFGYETNHPSRISASSLSNASAGSVVIQTPLLSVSNGGVVEVNGSGEGGAGNLEVNSDLIFLNNNASLQAQLVGGKQGNINLTSQFLLLRNGSNITTNATGTATGGNINIETVNLVALENSNLTANAVQGQGGNIVITAQGLFFSPDSQITASSEFGVDGVVTINNPEADESAALLELPSETTDSSQQIAQGCEWVRNNSFILTGRGGTPKNPSNILINDQMWSDLRDLSDQLSVIRHQSVVSQSSLIEANTWIVNEQGNVELLAVVNPQATQHNFFPANCAGK